MTKNIPSQLMDGTKDMKLIDNSSFDQSSSSNDYERENVWHEQEGLSIQEQFKEIPAFSSSIHDLFEDLNAQ
jgi:hypothetical protein